MKLLTQKPAREITVRELTELAKVSRGTFYFHYSDIYDLLRQLENDQLEAMESVVSGVIGNLNSDEPPQALGAMFEYIAANGNLTRALLGPHAGPEIEERLKQMIEDKCVGELAWLGRPEKEQGFYAGFAVNGCLGVVKKWLEGGCEESPEQMARLTWRAIRAIGNRGEADPA